MRGRAIILNTTISSIIEIDAEIGEDALVNQLTVGFDRQDLSS